jgi:lysophospholipase II
MDHRPQFPQPHIVLPTSDHTHTIILLHGRGSNGQEFAEELFQGESFSEQTLPQHFPGLKWIFPTAHERFSTVFQEDLVEWFDIYSLTDPGLEEELQIDGLRESVGFVQGLVNDEARVFGRGQIIMGGISQGCAVAITVLLAGGCGTAAFVGFNGWMPLMGKIKEGMTEAAEDQNALDGQKCGSLAAGLRASLGVGEAEIPHPSDRALNDDSERLEEGHRHTPIFLSHTVDDRVIDIALGREMRETLVELGMHRVMWKEHDAGGHWIPEPEGFEDIVGFLSGIVGALKEQSGDERDVQIDSRGCEQLQPWG